MSQHRKIWTFAAALEVIAVADVSASSSNAQSSLAPDLPATTRGISIIFFSQVDEPSRFIRANRDPKLPPLLVGDFNTFPPVRANFLMVKKQILAG